MVVDKENLGSCGRHQSSCYNVAPADTGSPAHMGASAHMEASPMQSRPGSLQTSYLRP